jgi:hypothetical protein
MNENQQHLRGFDQRINFDIFIGGVGVSASRTP